MFTSAFLSTSGRSYRLKLRSASSFVKFNSHSLNYGLKIGSNCTDHGSTFYDCEKCVKAICEGVLEFYMLIVEGDEILPKNYLPITHEYRKSL